MRRLPILAAVLVAACTQTLKLSPDDSPTVLSHQLITAPNPGEKGSFAVKTMYYGSGTDKRRAEFRDSVALKPDRAARSARRTRRSEPGWPPELCAAPMTFPRAESP